jgi:hypothetical protein
MAHYSVFYFLGRAASRFAEESDDDIEYPEDVLFLLDSAGDNFEHFMRLMNELGKDCGITVFEVAVNQFPKGFEPFQEISDYRDTLLHNTVIGKVLVDGRTCIPRWSPDKSISPLERAKNSWLAAGDLKPEDRISVVDLLRRLIDDASANAGAFLASCPRTNINRTTYGQVARSYKGK